MKKLLALLFLAPLALFGKVSFVPDPVPPFQASAGKRVAAEFKDSSFKTPEGNIPLYSLVFGNKRVGIKESRDVSKRQDNIVSVIIENREVLAFSFWGSYKDLGFGYPFKTKEGTVPQLTSDPQNKSITYSKEYLLPDATSAKFTFTLKALDDGRAELSWDCSGPEGVGPWPTFTGNYREVGIEIDGNAVDFPDLSVFTGERYQQVPVGSGTATKIVYAPETPLKSFAIELPAPTAYSLTEFGGKDLRCSLAGSRKGSLIIDLGLSSTLDASGPAPIAGIDFWGNDAVDVPAPSSRNILPNPSFEQGLRYWRWWGGGASYKPVETPVYSVVDGGHFGGKALAVRAYSGAQVAQSMPFAVENGKTYTVSFYAKAEKPGTNVMVGVSSAMGGSKLTWGTAQATSHKLTTTDWERKSFTFTSDTRGICLQIAGSQPVFIDGIQVEEGTQPTEFVAPPVEAAFACSDPHNVVESGKAIDGKLILSGSPGAKGNVAITVRDFYRRDVLNVKLSYTLDEKGSSTLNLPLDKAALGKGIFVVKAELQPAGAQARTDYYRFAVLKSLDNTHPTATLFGNSLNWRITEGDAIAKLYTRYGWGYDTCYGGKKEEAEFLDKYHIAHGPSLITYNFDGFGHIKDQELIKKFKKAVWLTNPLTDEDLKFIEETVYDTVMANLWCKSWALSTESEGESDFIRARNFDEYAKVLIAFHQGVKRAKPDAIVYPDGGTSGFSDSRGLVEMTGYMASTRGKVKWDAMAVHPYGGLDGVRGTNDLDACMRMLVDTMKNNGYGPETPIHIDECFNATPTKIPEWGDIGSNDNYSAGLPSYDSGWAEFVQASCVARTYLMCMKYWPQLNRVNIWCSTFPVVDQYLTPAAFCLIPNILGNLFPNPKFQADIRPAAGIRGYAFDDENGNCTVALWCAMDRVDEGFEKGPAIGVHFGDVNPKVIDLMGNPRSLPKAKNGMTPLQLSPAPLFLRVDKKQADSLVAALSKAEVSGVGSSLRLSVKPVLGGKVEAKLENLTANPLKGKLLMKDATVPFEVAPMSSALEELPFKLNAAPGTIEPWKQTIGVEFVNGKRDLVKWDMSSFTVPHTAAPLPLDPDNKAWDAIPAIPVSNWMVKDTGGLTPPRFGYPGDLDAKFQIAWDKDNLYVRVTGVDDKFVALPQEKWSNRAIWQNDGCVELYLDTIAGGRANLTQGYDQYDYRYDFAPADGSAVSGPGSVYRLQEVNCQLAGGMSMPTKEQAAKGIKCEYRRNGGTYSYVMILPQLYLEPLHLEKGWRAGCALFIHDKDAGHNGNPDSPEKGVSISTKKGISPNMRPDLWPIMVLGE